MKKYYPLIYPEETLFSYISRCYSRCGIIWRKRFTNDVFLYSEGYVVDHIFSSGLSQKFIKEISKLTNLDELFLEHTLFKYYVRFLSGETKSKSFENLKNGVGNSNQWLGTTPKTKTSYLKYCPVCVKEDRKKYGESYFHVIHSVDGVNVCPHHRCKLIKTSIEITKNKASQLIPLELIADEDMDIDYEIEPIEYKVSKYIYDLWKRDLDFKSSHDFGSFLNNKLDNNFHYSKGDHVKLKKLFRYLNKYYEKLKDFDLTIDRLGFAFRNKLNRNVYDMVLLSIFEDIKVNEL